MAKLLLMRNTPMPLRAIVQVLRARLQSRVEGQADAADCTNSGQDQIELERAHAAAPTKSPRTAAGADGPGLPSAVGGPLAAGARGAPSNWSGETAGLPFRRSLTGAPYAPAPRETGASGGTCALATIRRPSRTSPAPTLGRACADKGIWGPALERPEGIEPVLSSLEDWCLTTRPRPLRDTAFALLTAPHFGRA